MFLFSPGGSCLVFHLLCSNGFTISRVHINRELCLIVELLPDTSNVSEIMT